MCISGHKCIKLNSFSSMHVNLAAQVLSASMAIVLREFSTPDTVGTAQFCEMVDSFFDCLNVRSTVEHQRKRKPFLAPYTSMDDPRFVCWKMNFLAILSSGKKAHSTDQGISQQMLEVECFCLGRRTWV